MAALTVAVRGTRAARPRAGRSERGAELIEFALVLPLVLLVLAGILDMGFLFKDYEVLTNAAREGARVAAMPGFVPDDVVTRVNAYLAAGGYQGTATTTIDQVTLVTDVTSGRTIDGVKVTVSSPHTYFILGPIVRMVQGSDFPDTTLRAVATMRVELAAGL